jgi:DNA-repair protein complementing XP-A cells
MHRESFQELSNAKNGGILEENSSYEKETSIKSSFQIIDSDKTQDDDNDKDDKRIKKGKCDDCGENDLYLDGILLEHFRVKVCFTCKREDFESKEKKYAFLSKSQAKREFLLPASYVEHLPCLLRQNPYHESFAPLKLYLQKHILKEAIDLYGSIEELNKEKEKRRTLEYTKAAQRTRHLLGRRQLVESLAIENKSNGKKQKTKREYIPVAEKDHRHLFEKEYPDPNATTNSSTEWIKECNCGMKVAFEKW